MRSTRAAALFLALLPLSCSLGTAGEGPADGVADAGADDGAGEGREAEADRGDARDADRGDAREIGGDDVAADVLPDAADAPGDVAADAPPLDGGDAAPFCGDGVAEGGEACDGLDTGGLGCTDLGYAGGDLGCTAGCTFDTFDCIAGCVDACAAEGDRQCSGTVIQDCVRGTDGCLAWADEHDCAADTMVCDPAPGDVRCLGGSGDSCDAPLVLGTLPVRTNGGDITAAYHDYQDFVGARCDTASGVEAVFVRWMTAGESVRLRETGNVDVVLRVLATCSNSAPCLASRNEPENPGLTFTAPTDGNYYFVVEAVHAAPSSKNYDITIEPAPGGDTCADPLVADPLPLEIRGSDIRTAYADDVRFAGPGCSPADGIDVFLSRTMRAGETVRLRETGSLDVVLRVVASCDPVAPCLADRDAPEDPGLTFTAPADGTYRFVVESKLALPSSVAYDIFLEDAPPGNLCSDPLAAGVPFTLTGSDFTTTYTDDLNFTGPGCTPAGGPEVVLAVPAVAGGSFWINEAGTLDSVIRVLASCDPTAPCLYSQDAPENPGVLFVAPSSGTYYVVIESALAFPAARAYDIRLAAP